MDSKVVEECDDVVGATENEEGGHEVQNMEPDTTAPAQALTWKGYGDLDVEARRKVIAQLWAFHDGRRVVLSGCQEYPAGE
jgi:hypothetical protein